MAAPTPLSGYTDGLASTWDVMLWILGGLTVVAGVVAVAYAAFLTGYVLHGIIGRRWTSWRLHREHARSGRG